MTDTALAAEVTTGAATRTNASVSTEVDNIAGAAGDDRTRYSDDGREQDAAAQRAAAAAPDSSLNQLPPDLDQGGSRSTSQSSANGAAQTDSAPKVSPRSLGQLKATLHEAVLREVIDGLELGLGAVAANSENDAQVQKETAIALRELNQVAANLERVRKSENLSANDYARLQRVVNFLEFHGLMPDFGTNLAQAMPAPDEFYTGNGSKPTFQNKMRDAARTVYSQYASSLPEGKYDDTLGNASRDISRFDPDRSTYSDLQRAVLGSIRVVVAASGRDHDAYPGAPLPK